MQTQTDYSAGQREAAHRVLVEIANILDEYKDDILVVGGWVPDLYFPDDGHIGSIDVDILLNHFGLTSSAYATIERILLANGYVKHACKFFTFVKKVIVDGIAYDVDLDILAGKYGGSLPEKHSQHIQGVRALKATGGNFAFEIPATEIKVEAKRPDGAMDTARIKVISMVPFLAMKTAALGRGKPKDAYDIYFCIKHFHGDIVGLAEEFQRFKGNGLVEKTKVKLQEKFASPEHAGPQDVSDFLGVNNEEEIEFIKRDAYEQVNAFLDLIKD